LNPTVRQGSYRYAKTIMVFGFEQILCSTP
jgi:hypothetical protein